MSTRNPIVVPAHVIDTYTTWLASRIDHAKSRTGSPFDVTALHNLVAEVYEQGYRDGIQSVRARSWVEKAANQQVSGGGE